jgi:hypothetical protein
MITLSIEIPEVVYTAMQQYLDTHPAWDQDRAMQAAMSLFLLQNGNSDRAVSRIYLDSLFNYQSAS